MSGLAGPARPPGGSWVLLGVLLVCCRWWWAGCGGRRSAAVPWRAMVSGTERGARASRLACHPLSELRVVVSI